jgi:son of sevenless-like protein
MTAYIRPAYSIAEALTASHPDSPDPPDPPNTDGAEENVATFFVRALYDYQSTDTSSLSFRAGDLIEVLSQLESGWWDGLLDNERGWFPSNYVEVLSNQELEQEFPTATTTTPHSAANHNNLTNGHTPQTEEDSEWSEEDMLGGGAGIEHLAETVMRNATSTSATNDFWMPQVTSEGQASVLTSFIFPARFLTLPCLGILSQHSDRRKVARPPSGCRRSSRRGGCLCARPQHPLT